MNFKEQDKPIQKSINSNLLRVQRTDNPVSKFKYLLRVMNDTIVFAYILRSRGDIDNARIYITQAEIVHEDIGKLLAQIRLEVTK